MLFTHPRSASATKVLKGWREEPRIVMDIELKTPTRVSFEIFEEAHARFDSVFLPALSG